MRAWLKEISSKHGLVLVIAGIGIPAAVLGGIFVDSISAATSWAIVCAVLILVLVLREWHFASPDRKTPEQLQLSAHAELSRTRAVLSRLTDATRVEFEEAVHVRHHIPFSGSEWSERITTTSVQPGHELYWRRLKLKKYGPNDPTHQLVLTQVTCGGRPMDYCELGGDISTTEFIFVLEPPLKAASGTAPAQLEWTIAYQRPGTWDPLRSEGEDFLTFQNPKPSSRTTVELIFSGWKKPPTDLFSRQPPVGVVEAEKTAAGDIVRWIVDNPAPHVEHKAWVRAE